MPKNGTSNGNLANNNGNWQITAASKEDIDNSEHHNNLPLTSFDGNPQSKLQKKRNLRRKQWYFVTKIVLTYCEKKLL